MKTTVHFEELENDLRKIISSGILTSGRYVDEFEARVADYVGVPHAIATTSGTTALHLALTALDIGPGDEVICSDFTFPASGNMVVQCGAVPVLVDNMTGGFALDLEEVESHITPRTKAILPVDVFGIPTDMERVGKIATGHGLAVVSDAACSLGASVGNRKTGSWPDIACFSFHPRKIIATGEGGMITTTNDNLVERIRLLRNHGSSRAFVGMGFQQNGFNYRLTEIQAAMGIAQMNRIDEFIKERHGLAMTYRQLLAGVPKVSLPMFEDPHWRTGTFQSFVILLDDGVDRDRIVQRMRERGVETTLGTYAMHAQPSFARFGYAPGDLPNSWRAQQQSLTLPLYSGMTAEEMDQVVHELAEAIEDAR